MLGTFAGHRMLQTSGGGRDRVLQTDGVQPLARGNRKRQRRQNRRRRATFVEHRLWTDPDVATYESFMLSHSSSLACEAAEFDTYVRDREAMQDAARACYERPAFRNQRFEGYVLKRSSEDKFVQRLVSTFCHSADPPPAAPWRHRSWMALRAAGGDDSVIQWLLSPEGQPKLKQLVLIYGN